MSRFTCPRCGSHEWGSSYNFDGPGDTPMTSDIGSGRSIHYRGTFQRLCHGRISDRSCLYTWNSRDDLAHGILPLEQETIEAQR